MSEKLQGSDGLEYYIVGKTPDGTRIAGNLSSDTFKIAAESAKRIDEEFGSIERVKDLLKDLSKSAPEAHLQHIYSQHPLIDQESARLDGVDPMVSGSFYAGLHTFAAAVSGMDTFGLPLVTRVDVDNPNTFIREHKDINGDPYIGRCPFQGYAVKWKRVADEARQKKSSFRRVKDKIASKFK